MWPACTSAVAPFYTAGRFGHLRVCMERDWQEFGGSRAEALEHLIVLAEYVGCRDKPSALPPEEAVCLARGVAAVLAAVESAGRVQSLLAADPAAAACLCDSLMQAAGDLRRCWLPANTSLSVECAFLLLGLDRLRAACADVRRSLAGAAQRAYAAARLANCFLEAFVPVKGFSEQHRRQQPQLELVEEQADAPQVGRCPA